VYYTSNKSSLCLLLLCVLSKSLFNLLRTRNTHNLEVSCPDAHPPQRVLTGITAPQRGTGTFVGSKCELCWRSAEARAEGQPATLLCAHPPAWLPSPPHLLNTSCDAGVLSHAGCYDRDNRNNLNPFASLFSPIIVMG
jgi:hypothetical protein